MPGQKTQGRFQLRDLGPIILVLIAAGGILISYGRTQQTVNDNTQSIEHIRASLNELNVKATRDEERWHIVVKQLEDNAKKWNQLYDERKGK